MKITIETESGTIQSVQPPAAAPSSESTTVSQGPAASTGVTLSELFQRAAAMGAQNAGPAPSLSSAIGPGPIVASIGGGGNEASMITASAGAPPEHVYKSDAGCE